jgi:hypothetical protein
MRRVRRCLTRAQDLERWFCGVNHTVTGNPDRFRSGTTVIRDADDSWKASLPMSAKLAAAALSWPLFWRYGYRYAPVRRSSGLRA